MLNPGRSQANRDKLVILLPDPRIRPADLHSPLKLPWTRLLLHKASPSTWSARGCPHPPSKTPCITHLPLLPQRLQRVTSSVSSHSTLPLASYTSYRLHHGHSFPHLSPLLDCLSTSSLTPALSLVLSVGQYACSSDCTALSGIHSVRTTELWTVDPL